MWTSKTKFRREVIPSGQSKISQKDTCAVLRDEDILGFYVSMRYAPLVAALDCIDKLYKYPFDQFIISLEYFAFRYCGEKVAAGTEIKDDIDEEPSVNDLVQCYNIWVMVNHTLDHKLPLLELFLTRTWGQLAKAFNSIVLPFGLGRGPFDRQVDLPVSA